MQPKTFVNKLWQVDQAIKRKFGPTNMRLARNHISVHFNNFTLII